MTPDDSTTFANAATSPTASDWSGIWCSLRVASDLTGTSVELIEELIVRGLVETEKRNGRKVIDVGALVALRDGGPLP